MARRPPMVPERAHLWPWLLLWRATGAGGVMMVAALRLEVEGLWCRAPPAIILATAALPDMPGRCLVRRATGARLRGRGMPLHVR